jgi:hypothetical protein
MSTQPTIQDADRITTYTPNASAGPFDVGFPIFDSTGGDLAVELDGVAQVGNWTIATAPFPGFWGAPNAFTATLTFSAPVSGTLVIEGRRAPRRTSQYAEGRGIPARDQNTEWNILTAITRELYQRVRRTLIAPVSDAPIDMTLPAKAVRANKLLEFDDQGRPVTTRGFPDIEAWAGETIEARDAAREYRDQAQGHASVSKQWADASHASETAAAAYAALAGVMIYDFGTLDQAPVGVDDWGTL